MRTQRAQSGFTLLELILAMTMVVVLAASLYSAMNIAYRAKRTAEHAISPIRAASIAIDLVSRDFENIVIPNILSNQTNLTDFETLYLSGPFIGVNSSGGAGEADEVEFHTLCSDGNDLPLAEGIHRVGLLINSADYESPSLVRRITRNLLSGTEQQPIEEVICRNVRSLSFRYFDGTDWYEDWDSTALEGALPLAVEITLVLNMENVQQGNQEANTYSVKRVVTIPVAQPITPTT
jgi:prepilin-type N-terminal cleavage/methylation domain-containing protein